jgi:hypothetical protein
MAALSVVGQVVRFHVDNESLRSAALLFKLSAEQTIPAYFSAVMLLASGGLLWVIARAAQEHGQPFVRHWQGLAVAFAYLSIDEACGIHELAAEPMRGLLGEYAIGVFYYAWVVPGTAMLLVMGIVYLRFVLHLSHSTRNGLIRAAAVYVGGAIGMEMVGSYYASTISTSSVRYALAALVEETMEMLGVVLLIHTLLVHLSREVRDVRVSLAAWPASNTTAASSRGGAVVGRAV